MKKFFSEFKDFIARGNVMDMATAVIIGGAFNKIVTSLVNDLIMPLIGILVGGLNVTDWKWVITPAVLDEAGKVVTAENALCYGNFIQTVLDFLIVAFCIFAALKAVLSFKNSVEKEMHKRAGKEDAEEPDEEPEEPELTPEQQTLCEIRDLLKAQVQKD
mgnify:CR=1 FL=1